MKRRIGIVLILLGIGILIGSGYLFPVSVHTLRIEPNTLMPAASQVNWWPYVAAAFLLGGVIFLLNSHAQEVKAAKIAH